MGPVVPASTSLIIYDECFIQLEYLRTRVTMIENNEFPKRRKIEIPFKIRLITMFLYSHVPEHTHVSSIIPNQSKYL